MGKSPELTKHLIELRGIGIIDVKEIFGVESVKDTQQIDMEVHLEEWDEKKTYERMGLNREYNEYLGNKIVTYNLPVRPGRNIAVIVETAAVNHRQEQMGYNTAQRLYEKITKQQLERDLEEDEDEDKYWYWLEKDGKAYIPDSDDMKATGYAYDLGDGALEVDGSQFSFAKKKINSKDYFFNADGEMLSDFVNVVHTEDANVIDLGMYYFGGSSDGSMKTGSQTVKDDNGDSFKFYFGTKDNNTTGEAKGKGVTGNKNNKLYYMGHLVAAEDYKYQPVWYDMDNNGEDDTLFIVNQNGSIQHSALEYKEDGDILIDAKTNKVAFKTKNTKDNVWDKYSVLDEENADKLIINVEVLDEKVVMPINEVYDPATPDDASPANAQ